jgi:SPP1 gp7 family putative phage head morphogenesis protein
MSDEEIESLFHAVYSGSVTVENLPVKLYGEYVDKFARAIDEGFKNVAGTEGIELRALLYENIQLFSSAKTFQLIKDLQGLLEGGADFETFRNQAIAKYKLYNETWLKTELGFTVESASAGKRWVGIWNDKDLFPLLEYVTVGDARVRAEHAALDGMIRPVTDPVWNKYYPPWSWRCRCTTKSLEEGEISSIMNKIFILPKIKKFFQNNVGKTGKIFNGFHPYFKEVPDKDKELARDNFGLPFIKVTKDGK